MEIAAQKLFDAIEDRMKLHNPLEIDNIKQSYEYIQRTFIRDKTEIDAYFDELCKEHNYDPVDFSTAKIIETK